MYLTRFDLVATSGATGEATFDADPAESGAGGARDAVSLWTAGPPYQGTESAGTVSHPIMTTKQTRISLF